MLKKILALTVATVMVVSMGLMSFAETNNLHVDGSMTVNGLDSGDQVLFYKILAWSGSHSGTQGWIPGSGVIPSGSFMDDSYIITMIGSGTNPQMGITYDIASEIAANLSDTWAYSGTASGTPASVTFTTDDPGLYIVIITPAKEGVVYNPVFVANDYSQSGTRSGTDEFTIVLDEKSYSGTAVAKKKKIEVNKTITNQTNNNDEGIASGTPLEPDASGSTSYHTANLGDVIDFEVRTTVPSFSQQYTDPTFVVKDTLKGLILDSGSIKLYKDESGTPLETNAYVQPIVTDSGSYTITFTEDYLHQTRPAQAIVIKYKAQIDPSGTKNYNVNVKDNTVTVNYSNNPNNSGSSGTLKDRTKNYVFSIDADVLGGSSWVKSGTEVVKVALDADGNEVLENSGTYLNSGTNPVGALEGAVFHWQGVQNPALSGTVVSDAEGRLKIWGIDAGEYDITETDAPDGYVQDLHTYRIKIEPKLERRDYYEDGVHVVYDRLVSYKVYVDTDLTAEYFMNENPSGSEIDSQSGTLIISHEGGPITVEDNGTISGSTKGKIKNVQGVALPSTGGIGTTLFYAGGAILVLLAGILLVSKRRMA